MESPSNAPLLPPNNPTNPSTSSPSTQPSSSAVEGDPTPVSLSSSSPSLRLVKQADYPLPRAAFNMCIGAFSDIPTSNLTASNGSTSYNTHFPHHYNTPNVTSNTNSLYNQRKIQPRLSIGSGSLTSSMNSRINNTVYDNTSALQDASSSSSSSSSQSLSPQRESICIQSLDGHLCLIQHDTLSHVRPINRSHFTVPGPIAYVPAWSAFVLSNSNMEIIMIKYQTLTNDAGLNANQHVNVSSTIYR